MVDGEIRVRGTADADGLPARPKTTTEAFDDDGYFRTGDLGLLTEDGHLVVTGRAKDIIIRNGENISPKEVEDILDQASRYRRSPSSAFPTPAPASAPARSSSPRQPGAGPSTICGDLLNAHGVAAFKTPEQVVMMGRAAQERCRESPQTPDRGRR